MSVLRRRPLLASVVLVAGAGLALTACGPDNTDSAAPAASAPASAPVTAGAPAGGAPATTSPSRPAPHTTSGQAGQAGSGGSGGGSAEGRPCDIRNLSISASARSGAPNQWVIEVRNTGGGACSLSSLPAVDLGDSAAQDRSKNIKPVLASGTARYTVQAGQKAYVVIDLDPSGATAGTAQGVNEINVLVDQDGTNMPLANIRNFPLPGEVRVLNPRMGLYRASVAEAVASAATAGK
ncbi:DUF4232 domain-containing protein [Kitasatospora sp. NPDC101157]|uniref:DUF4232 domain-containing protein n=1 Tax=Kitasatospora sp. NPDC101157 TaxID=3364098 RepID=UPI003818E409